MDVAGTEVRHNVTELEAQTNTNQNKFNTTLLQFTQKKKVLKDY